MLTVPAHAAHAGVLWTADAERPWQQEWASMSCQNASRVQRVTSPVAQGHYAYRIQLHDGDDSYGERCELGMGNPTRNGFPLFYSGDERWISFQVYLPDNYPINTDTWNNFFQIHQAGDLGTPAVSMEVENHQFILMNSDTNHESSGKNWWWQGPASQNRWVKFTLHVKFSADPNVGFMELYGDLDGNGMKLLMPLKHMWTMKQQDGQTVPDHARIGMYRDPAMHAGTTDAYYDGFTIATDRASAEANAFAPADSTPPNDQPTTGTSRRAHAHHSGARLWLRVRKAAVAAANEARPLAWIYGGVRKSAASPHKWVVIEARRRHHWEAVAATHVGANGKFSLVVALPGPAVRLRAYMSGLGHSRALLARG